MDPKELAKQLRKPEGDTGRQVASMMNQGNGSMIEVCIKELKIQAHDVILEIGFGNGKHIPDLLSKADNLIYKGIDFSESMVAEAKALNPALIAEGKVEIKEAGVSSIPFPSDYFDKVISVNTIYFWPDRKKDILEIKRVMKPGATFCLGFRPKYLIEKVEFTRYGFDLVEASDAENLLAEAGFKNISYVFQEEPDMEFQGLKVNWGRICMIATK